MLLSTKSHERGFTWGFILCFSIGFVGGGGTMETFIEELNIWMMEKVLVQNLVLTTQQSLK